jgi:hypothetical protein
MEKIALDAEIKAIKDCLNVIDGTAKLFQLERNNIKSALDRLFYEIGNRENVTAKIDSYKSGVLFLKGVDVSVTVEIVPSERRKLAYQLLGDCE